jgi:hypothetical protein
MRPVENTPIMSDFPGRYGRPDRIRRPTRKRLPNNLFCSPADGIIRPQLAHLPGGSSSTSRMIQ